MSRWLTPQKAARVAKDSQRRREERFKSRLLLAGIVLLMAVTYVAWAIISARLRHRRHHQHDQTPSSRSTTNRAGRSPSLEIKLDIDEPRSNKPPTIGIASTVLTPALHLPLYEAVEVSPDSGLGGSSKPQSERNIAKCVMDAGMGRRLRSRG